MENKINVFSIYAAEDTRLIDRLKKHLFTFKETESANVVFDGVIDADNYWEDSVFQTLSAANVILVFLSVDVLSSTFFTKEVLPNIDSLRGRKALRVIPILLSRCNWGDTSLGSMLAIPRDGKPINSWEDESHVLFNVCQEIVKALRQLRRSSH